MAVRRVTARLGGAMQTLVELLDQSARRWGAQPAVALHAKEPWGWTYAELWDATLRVAGYLRAQGVGPGERVVLWGANSPEWVAAFYGAQCLGAAIVPLDLRSQEDFLRRIEAQAEPRHILLGAEQAKALGAEHPPRTRLDQLRAIIAATEPLDAADLRVTPDDMAELVFTSGTTGNPKGVILTQRNIVANAMMAATAAPPTPKHRVLSILPLSHMFEQTAGLNTPLSGGASLTYVGSLRPDVIFDAMSSNQITNMGCVPQVLQLFRDGIEREVRKQGREQQFMRLHAVARHLPLPARRLLFRRVLQRMGGAFEFFVTGGAFLEPELAAWWEGLGVKVLQGYGMTEAAPIVSTDTLRERNPGAVGRPLPGIDVRIADDSEILVRGANISPGYWRNETATTDAFVDGWYQTGDLGVLDKRGCLRLRGRKKNLIVLANGMNVYPEDVERELLSDRRVKDAVVIGVERGQDVDVHAVLVLAKDTAVADVAPLIREANARLAPHQALHGHTLWPDESFPLTPTLKPRRAEILARLPELRAAAAAAPEHAPAKV